MYVSHDEKEPTATKNMAAYQNPTKIMVQGQVNAKTQQMYFDKQFLYISVVAEAEGMEYMRMIARFYSDVRISKAKAAGGEEEELGARRKDDEEIDVEDFSLGPGTLQDKRDRVLKFVEKVKDDGQMR